MEIQQSNQLTKKERRELRRREKTETEKRIARSRLIKRIVFWLVVILVLGGGVFGMIKLASRPSGDTGPVITVDSVTADDWVKGKREAKVILVEYSDFQCPACAFYYPLLKKISEEFGDKIAVVYRHFPLPKHQNAKSAAYAAEAAGKQGKFWEMHDIIFDNQKEWEDKPNSDGIFITYAQTLNLSIDQFKQDLSSKEIKEKVETAYRNTTRLGLNSTPTFFLNGKKLTNPRNYEEFRNVIIQAINGNP